MGLLDQFSGDGLMGGAGAFLQNPSFTPQSTSGNFGRGLLGYQEAKKEAELLKLKALLGASTMQHQSAMNEHYGMQNAIAQQGLLDKRALGQAYQELQGMGLDYSNPDHLNQAAAFLASKGLHQPANEIRKQGNDLRKDAIQTRQADAANRLSGLLNPGDGSKVYTNEKEADQAAQDYVRSGKTEPYNATFIPPNIISSLAVQADPKAAIPSLLKQDKPMTEFQQRVTDLRGRALDLQGRSLDARISKQSNAASSSSSSAAPTAEAAPEPLKIDILRYAIDGTLPTNIGRGVQGAAEAKAIRTGAEKLYADYGIPPEEVRALQLNNKALGASLGQIQRQAGNILTYEKTAIGGAKIALEMSDKVDRLGSPILDKWINAGRKNVFGDVDVTRLNNAVETFTNEYAKVMSGSSGGQATTVSMQQHAREMLSGAMDKKQFGGTVDLMLREMKETRETAFDKQIADVMSKLKLTNRNAAPVPTSAVTAPAAPAAPNVERGTSRSGKPIHRENGQWVYD